MGQLFASGGQLSLTARKSCELKVPVSTGQASLVTQMVKNIHAMQETQVQSLGQEDPLEKGMATHSSILAWEILTLAGKHRWSSCSYRKCPHGGSSFHSQFWFLGQPEPKELAS